MINIKNNIINDDWGNIFPQISSNSFDLIYTDPPYEMNYKSNIPGSKEWNKTGKSKSKFSEPLINDKPSLINWERLANESYRLLKKNTYLFIHCNPQLMITRMNHFLLAGFTLKGCIVWNKKSAIGGDLKGAMKKDWEPIVYFAKGKPRLNSINVCRKGEIVKRNRISEIQDWEFSVMAQDKKGFPTQKPIDLAKQIIELTTKKGDLIADPFAGSNTALIAAKELNRNYFGIEIDKKVFTKFYL